MAQGSFIAYYRVSTQRQGRSGLGLEAQRKAVEDYLNGGRWRLIEEYTDVESGKHADRPQLQAALAACRKHKAKLVIAKLDRLSRNVAFIAALMDSKVGFVAADMPEANELTIHVMAAMAQYERKQISARTKGALAAAKRRGVRLGSPCPEKGAALGARAARRQAQQRADNLAPTIAGLRSAGITTLQAMADALNARGIPSARGGQWAPQTVSRLLQRMPTA
jgi:DNA invertase Pin-like site-specific DNA recombinase